MECRRDCKRSQQLLPAAFARPRGAQAVESTADAVAVGRAYLLLALSSASASISRPWLRFPPPLIEPDMQNYCIRLSDGLRDQAFASGYRKRLLASGA